MQNNISFNGHNFKYQEDNKYYECRGDSYYDDYHDQVPEPSLQKAANMLQDHLEKQGINAEIEWGEKGWIEVML